METNDNYGKLLEDYEQLKNKNDLLEKFTKKRILDNAQLVRTIKESHQKELSKYKDALSNLQETLKKQTSATHKLNIDVNSLKKYSMNLKKINSKLKSEIGVLKEYSISFETLFEAQIQKAKLDKKSIVFVMAGIDNFNYLQNALTEFTTVDRFTLGIYKFIKSRLTSDDIVFYNESGTYFIGIVGKTVDEVKQIFIKIGRKKIIHDNAITISSSISLLKPKENWDMVMERALSSYAQTLLESKTSNILVV
jgi:GGDEF domain-containing protein